MLILSWDVKKIFFWVFIILGCAAVSVLALISLVFTSFGMLEYNEYGLDLSHISK